MEESLKPPKEQAARLLLDTAVYLVRGMGFDAEINFKDIAVAENIGTVQEGIRGVIRCTTGIMQGYDLDPRQVFFNPQQQQQPGIILP